MNTNQKLNLENLKIQIINNNNKIEQINAKIDQLETKIRKKERKQKIRLMHKKRRNKYLVFSIFSILIGLISLYLGLTIPKPLISTAFQITSLITIFPIIKNLNYLIKENTAIKKLPILSSRNININKEETEKLNNMLEKYHQENLQLITKLNKQSENPIIPPFKRQEKYDYSHPKVRTKNRF